MEQALKRFANGKGMLNKQTKKQAFAASILLKVFSYRRCGEKRLKYIFQALFVKRGNSSTFIEPW